MTSNKPKFKVGDLVVLSSRWTGKGLNEKVGDVAVVAGTDEEWNVVAQIHVVLVTFSRTGTTAWWTRDVFDTLT